MSQEIVEACHQNPLMRFPRSNQQIVRKIIMIAVRCWDCDTVCCACQLRMSSKAREWRYVLGCRSYPLLNLLSTTMTDYAWCFSIHHVLQRKFGIPPADPSSCKDHVEVWLLLERQHRHLNRKEGSFNENRHSIKWLFHKETTIVNSVPSHQTCQSMKFAQSYKFSTWGENAPDRRLHWCGIAQFSQRNCCRTSVSCLCYKWNHRRFSSCRPNFVPCIFLGNWIWN